MNLRKFSKEPVQISKPRYVKSIPLVNKRNRKGVPFLWRYKKGKGLDLGAEPLHIVVENPFPPDGLSLALQNLLRSVELH